MPPIARLPTLCLLACLAGPALSAAEGDARPINAICPVTGRAIDPTLPPVIVVIGKGDKAKRLLIGIAERSAANQIKADPQRFADAAKANRQAQ